MIDRDRTTTALNVLHDELTAEIAAALDDRIDPTGHALPPLQSETTCKAALLGLNSVADLIDQAYRLAQVGR